MMIQTRDQLYAACAFRQIEPLQQEWKDKDHPHRKAYSSMAFKLPVLIRMAGLAQALAFVQSRGKSPAKRLLDHIATAIGEGDAATLAKRSREANLSEYMQLTQKTLAATIWYKRFVQSLLDYEPSNDPDDDQGDEA